MPSNTRIHTPNLEFLRQSIFEICSGHDYSRTEAEVVTVTRKRYMYNTPDLGLLSQILDMTPGWMDTASMDTDRK